ncbi:hypothetical protein PR001_g33169 [Phytophthora rubi]|uniref:Uncharacterized protein n=1 Tax=Phytophthora rubi TaxID=129364 RepID=A0A6A3G7L7_9STRA|nr:hypothetical protein PR001_g33169 [Phytophthora rubi]
MGGEVVGLFTAPDVFLALDRHQKGPVTSVDPPADFQPVISHLNESLSWKQNLPLLLMGNGASELIDLVIRSVQPGG